jgi:hypothetical protein
MRKYFYFLILVPFAISSCGNNTNMENESKGAADSTIVENNSDKNEKKAVPMRTCECCGKEFRKRKGWSYFEGFGAKKTSNGKFCSKKCANDPQCK